MTNLFPRVVKAGLVLVDAASGRIDRVIALQYNPDSLRRSLQVQSAGGDGRDRSQALRLKGAAVETITLEAEIDATDQLADPASNADAVQLGIHPQLAALETLVHARADDLQRNHALAAAGILEILPLEAPLALFVWSKQRVVPVRVTELTITEEAFDVALNPIRAKVNLGLRVLSVDDLGFDHRGGTMFMSYLRAKEQLSGRSGSVPLAALGLEGLPS